MIYRGIIALDVIAWGTRNDVPRRIDIVENKLDSRSFSAVGMKVSDVLSVNLARAGSQPSFNNCVLLACRVHTCPIVTR
jgi:hypothetical protein